MPEGAACAFFLVFLLPLLLFFPLCGLVSGLIFFAVFRFLTLGRQRLVGLVCFVSPVNRLGESRFIVRLLVGRRALGIILSAAIHGASQHLVESLPTGIVVRFVFLHLFVSTTLVL